MHEAGEAALRDFDRAHPGASPVPGGMRHGLRADFIVGCDGRHGLYRGSLPSRASSLKHKFPGTGRFDHKLPMAELDELFSSQAAITARAENHVGLPLL